MKYDRIITAFFSAAAAAIILLLILYPERYVYSSMQGLLLFAKTVLPAIFPFMFITAVLTRTKSAGRLAKTFSPFTDKLFNAKGISPYVYIMSILSGYPVGSKIIADLYENRLITSVQATKMSTFCSTSGPLFIIGSVGAGMLGDKTAGLLLYAVHILSGILCGILFRAYASGEKTPLPDTKPQTDNILNAAMYSSVINILCVGGFITVFYILADMLTDFKMLYPLELIFALILSPFTKDEKAAKYLSQGIVEATRGSSLLSTLSGAFVLPCISFVIALGGLSIIVQQTVFLLKAKVNLKVFLLSKAVHAALAFALCYLFIII